LLGGSEIIASTGIDSGAQISGGEQDLFGLASGVTVFTGSQVVESGGIASNTTVSSGGSLVVLSSGLADPAIIYSGGSETISAGGTDLGALVSGTQLDYGFASGVTLSYGTQVVEAGGTASGTIVNFSGTEQVFGRDVGATLLAGGQAIRLLRRSGERRHRFRFFPSDHPLQRYRDRHDPQQRPGRGQRGRHGDRHDARFRRKGVRQRRRHRFRRPDLGHRV